MSHILVVFRDNVGDFMLAWPSFAMLKASCDCQVTALVPARMAQLAEICPWIDQLILYPGRQASCRERLWLQKRLRQEQFDAAISMRTGWRTAWLLWGSRIGYRLSSDSSLLRFCYSGRLPQRRCRAEQPEYEYNLDLVRHFLQERQSPVVEPEPPYLRFADGLLAAVRGDTAGLLGINPAKPWLMVHCGTADPAHHLSTAQYAELVLGLQQQWPDAPCVVMACPGEEVQAHELAARILAGGGHAYVYASREGVVRLAQVLANGALLLAGSGGPLHIAAALNIPTVGFFPAHGPDASPRWQPLNRQGRHLAFTPPGDGGCGEMSRIEVASLLPAIVEWRLSLGL